MTFVEYNTMTPKCCTFIGLSLLISVSEPFMLDTHFIQHVLGQFTIVNPIIVTTNLTATAEVKLIKLFSKNAQRTQIVNNFEAKTFLEDDGLCSKLLLVHDVTKINITNFLVGTTCPFLVLLNDGIIETVLSEVQIDIN
jgi:hypothetical protein